MVVDFYGPPTAPTKYLWKVDFDCLGPSDDVSLWHVFHIIHRKAQKCQKMKRSQNAPLSKKILSIDTSTNTFFVKFWVLRRDFYMCIRSNRVEYKHTKDQMSVNLFQERQQMQNARVAKTLITSIRLNEFAPSVVVTYVSTQVNKFLGCRKSDYGEFQCKIRNKNADGQRIR